MDELTTGPRRSPDRLIHRACVVAGCWCRISAAATTAIVAAKRSEPTRRTRVGAAPAGRFTIDLAAWRSVGLPVA